MLIGVMDIDTAPLRSRKEITRILIESVAESISPKILIVAGYAENILT